ncbi:neither inactivation nor afterpotential protein C [Euwallacea fornicatus]|uniref:neither inactivation nor afterpotential protein C n=1 Tax=Euwallacea fornicatus TaxID=995702 RepID=UPI0033900927
MQNTLLATIPDVGDRYSLGDLLGQGVFGNVYNATDTKASCKKVAIKIQKYDKDAAAFVDEEYEILKELGSCMYIVGFYGIFKKNNEVWLVLENCEGNNALDLAIGLIRKNKRLSEEHIAYILKEVVKALIYLHEHKIIHRDVKASNILLTKEGEVKLCDFGLSKKLITATGVLCETVGSPCWMAPEVVTTNSKDNQKGFYDNRVDVWSLGITAIELAEGRAPLQNMHPSRVLIQVAKNPPPTLEKLGNCSEQFHDFITECLVKNFEHRPYIVEIIEHPFFGQIPENNYHLSLEVKSLIQNNRVSICDRQSDVAVVGKYLKRSVNGNLEKILEEDLADLDTITEKTVLNLLEERFKNKEFYTFIGDILLSFNPYQKLHNYGTEYHKKYVQKSRSDNPPHIYAIADTAYQNVLHHKIPQQIVLTGESASGKTTNYLHIIDHLFYIAGQMPVNVFRIRHGVKLIHALTHASTPTNDYSTRCVFKTDISFGQSGKLTAAKFKILSLEKWRISSTDLSQCNFHILYYIYDGIVHSDATEKYKLCNNRDYKYLRILADGKQLVKKPRDDIEGNIIKYKKIFSYLEEFEFTEEQITTFFSVISAILNLGEIKFTEDDEDGSAILENKCYAANFSELLGLDERKFIWSLTNYCLIKKRSAIRKRNSWNEATSIRDALVNNLYNRFIDYVVGLINEKLEIGKAIFGSKYSIHLLDFPGFECFKQNHLPQLFINIFNEQLQFHFLQRIFAWEMQDAQEEGIDLQPFSFFNNRATLNQLLNKPEGVLSIIDDAAKRNLGGQYIIDNLQNQESCRVMITKPMEFAVAHYTGIVSYNVRDMTEKNRDFLPPEIIEVLRGSDNSIIKALFTKKLDRTGCLVTNSADNNTCRTRSGCKKIADQYSQIRNMRTSGAIFKAVCLDLLKELSVGGGSGGTHFVRCIRSNLKDKPQTFDRELVKHQIRPLTVVETAKIRQEGFPHRISFPEFLRRYKFLAFDFDECVDINKDNCRLLLIRLKMEEWAIGKSKVFLKYYNEEYLSRLYETQVRKIVKIQSIMRGFLVKCKINKQNKEQESECIEEIRKRRRSSVMTPEEAAEVIQKAYRKSAQKHNQVPDFYEPLGDNDRKFILPFAKKWKSHSIFHVLMRYRAMKLYDLFNFSQQVHFYNQNAFYHVQKIQNSVDFNRIDRKAQVAGWIGEVKPIVMKMKFRLNEIPFLDTAILQDPLTNVRGGLANESWDTPYKWRNHDPKSSCSSGNEELNTDLMSIPYTRDPKHSLTVLSTNSSVPKNEEKFKVKKFEITDGSTDDNRRGYKTGTEFRSNDNFKEKQERFGSVQLKKVDFKMESKENTYNSTPANSDFHFIKSSNITSKPRNVDPIAELRTIAQRRDSASEDDPPFNFQGMLRKTNFQKDNECYSSSRRDSLKQVLRAVRRFSIPTPQENAENSSANSDVKSPTSSSNPVHMELVPGLILEGVEVEL